MEIILVGLSLISLFIGALSSFFLFLVQPIWAIVDIAVSEKLSQGAKIALLLLILIGMPVCVITVVGIIFIPLIVLLPLFYGCFITASSTFQKATRMSFVFFVVAMFGTATSALLSSQVRENIQQIQAINPHGNDRYSASQGTPGGLQDASISKENIDNQEVDGPVGPRTQEVEFAIDPFFAIHFVPLKNESIAQFTLDGADPRSAIPIKRPSIYPLNHIAVDPSGPHFYGVTTHKFGKIDTESGEVV